MTKTGKKNISKSKILLVILFFLAIVIIIIKITAPYRDPKFLSAKITEAFSDTLKRNFGFEKVYISGRNLVFENVSISERKDFSGGDFLKIKKLILRPKLIKLIKNSTIAGSIRLSEPTIVLKKDLDGNYNISDLSGLDKNWKFENLNYEIENGILIAEDKKKNIYLQLSNIWGEISGFGEIKISSNISADYKGEKITAKTKIKAWISKTYDNFHIIAENIKLKNSYIFSAEFDYNVENKLPDEQKANYKLKIKNITFDQKPSAKDLDYYLTIPFKLAQALYGNDYYETDNFHIENINADAQFANGIVKISKMQVEGANVYLNLTGTINTTADNADLNLQTKSGAEELEISISGNLTTPEIKPDISVTMNDYITEGLKKIKEFIKKERYENV